MSDRPVATDSHRTRSSVVSAGSLFRQDIASLRALAVTLVVLFHAGVPVLSGGYVGVDVFFVISGFLMTALILRDVERDGRVKLWNFWARRIRRLLPASAVVLLGTIALSRLVLPPLRFPELGGAAISTASYVVNYWLAATGTDYLSNTDPSPLQHYWSLAVEEQFYLVWPLLIAAVIASMPIGRRIKTLTLLLGGLSALSLAMSILLTSYSQPWAFFSLPTRAWELGVGALIALAARHQKALSVGSRRTFSLLGFAAITVSATLYTADTRFPGYAAILPVVGAGLVIWSGCNSDDTRSVRMLPRRAINFLADISYSVYLWHWPVFILAEERLGSLGWFERSALLISVILLGWVTFKFVENPVRSGSYFKKSSSTVTLAVALTAISIAASSLASTLPILATNQTVSPVTQREVSSSVVQSPSFVPENVSPSLRTAPDDLPVVFSNGCNVSFTGTESDPSLCEYGDVNSERSIVLLGDSHAAQWQPSLDLAANRIGARLESLTKSACPTVTLSVENKELGRDYFECRQWIDWAVKHINETRPQLLVLGNASLGYRDRTSVPNYNQAWADGLSEFISKINPSTRVVVLGDTPRWFKRPIDCLSSNLATALECTAPRTSVLSSELDRAEAAATQRAGATHVATADWLCGQTCNALMGNVVVYRDSNHITATLAKLMSERFSLVLNGTSSGV